MFPVMRGRREVHSSTHSPTTYTLTPTLCDEDSGAYMHCAVVMPLLKSPLWVKVPVAATCIGVACGTSYPPPHLPINSFRCVRPTGRLSSPSCTSRSRTWVMRRRSTK